MQHPFTLATATALLLLLGCGDTGTSATLVDSAGANPASGIPLQRSAGGGIVTASAVKSR
jgi:hypothetical protein